MKTLKQRFMSFVHRQGSHWIWTSATSRGYPTIWENGGSQRADRVSYELFRGPIPAGDVIRHTCDIPMCVAPAHLIPGTHQQNTDDAVDRQRLAGMANSDHRPGPKPR